jgi:hypothetical protein
MGGGISVDALIVVGLILVAAYFLYKLLRVDDID